ncbi:uncharacterized protein [Amphiura filiformis]|uniref:uncharacterized protein n=1 Tax=Amphiura filiformis TaxID=82378 RepID=UPI003B219DE1
MRHWNARSARKKTIAITDNIIANDIDIFIITESWLAENDPVVIGELLPPGYSFMNFNRKGDEHGGIAIIHKSQISLQNYPSTTKTTYFEHASVVIKNTGLRIVTVYRPPPSKVNGFKTSQFLEEMESFLEDECLVPAKTIFLGDFNIHVDEPGKPEVARFLDTLVVNGLHQHIQEPTHISGHTIDLIISRPEDKLVSKSCVLPSLGSDHMLIDCVINCAKPAPLRVTSSVRNFKCMDKSEFTQNLTSEIEGLDLRGTADEMLGQLESSVSSVLDAHAPSQTRSRSLRPRFPWYNQEINDERCKRRRLERKWRKTRTDLDHVAYIEQSNRVNKLIQSAKEVYYNEALESSDCKNMFVVLNRLLNKNAKSLPCCDSALELSDSFARFLSPKLLKLDKNSVSIVAHVVV